MMKFPAALLACVLAAPAWADCKGLKVTDAWIPQAPPNAPVLAGYAKLSNDGGEPLRIEGVSGADFGSVELHRMSMENGMMQMRPLGALELPAHGGVVLADGGKHLMLMDPRRPFKAGDSSTLNFRCGKEQTPVPFTVREAAP
ncbi:MAG: copper chaperone PCu(A)C [Nevskia sp.]|nr:copper chaperone PCu(A)C [Nevskia sp.]